MKSQARLAFKPYRCYHPRPVFQATCSGRAICKTAAAAYQRRSDKEVHWTRCAIQIQAFDICATAAGFMLRLVVAFVLIGSFSIFTIKGPQLAAQQPNMRSVAETELDEKIWVRISWGGGLARTWRGHIRLNQGHFGQIKTLGMNVDSSASTFIDQNELRVENLRPSEFAGVDVELIGARDAEIQMEMSSLEQADTVAQKTIPITNLRNDQSLRSVVIRLDQSGNRMDISRAPGDRIRPDIRRKHLVFDPEEVFEFTVDPIDRLAMSSGSIQLRAELQRSRSDEIVWSDSYQLAQHNGQWISQSTLRVPMPTQPGAYDIVLTLVDESLASRLSWNRKHVERIIQVVVVDSRSKIIGDSNFGIDAWQEVAVIDPTDTDWRSRLPTLPGLRTNTGILKNEGASVFEFDNRQLIDLRPGGWISVPLKTQQLGQPHLVEVEYLDRGSNAIGISVLEPNANGQINQFGVDTGISVPDSVELSSPTVRRHRFYVWPNHETPYLLFANRHLTKNAFIGRVKILAGPQELPAKQRKIRDENMTRQYLAFYEKPLFADNFSVTKSVDPQTGQLLDDWQSFFTGAQRWAQYLRSNGYTGAMLVVASDGSGLYPSQLLRPSPRYDSGSFSTDGRDPLRKDVVELLLRVFESNGLQLIPVFHFNSPFPELEKSRAIAQSQSENLVKENIGLDLVDLEGISRRELARTSSTPISFYNVLDPRVRKSSADIVEEFANRYAGRLSIGGIGVLYSRDSLGVIPGQTWGADAITVQRFAQQSGLVEMHDPQRQQFLKKLLSSNQRQSWLAWRENQTADWLTAIEEQAEPVLRNGKLFVLATDMLSTQDAFSAIAPSLRRNINVDEALRRIAFPIQTIEANAKMVLLRPFEIAPENALAENRLNILLNQLDRKQNRMASLPDSGVLFTHRYSWAHFSQLQQLRPFGREASQPLMRLQPLVPSAKWNRQRLATGMTQSDCHYLVDGGWLTSFGQEEHSAVFLDTFLSLPDVKFESIDFGRQTAETDRVSQGLVVRQCNIENQTYFYVVNPTPWPVNARLSIQSVNGNVITTINGRVLKISNEESGQVVDLPLEPFGMIAAKSTKIMAIQNLQANFPTELAGRLQSRLNSLVAKISRAQHAAPIDVLQNRDFEKTLETASPGQPSQLYGWIHDAQLRGAVKTIVGTNPHAGSRLLSMQSDGQTVWIRSNEFVAPETGRLSISAWIRSADQEIQPKLRISVDGHDGRQSYYRYGSIGATADDKTASTIGTKWQRFSVHFDDLPPGSMRRLRMGFDLMSAGSVQIDDIQVYDRWLDEQDSSALTQLLALAGYQLTNKQDFDRCRRILASYWPRFLLEYFPDEPIPPQNEATESTSNQRTGDSTQESLLDQLVPDIRAKR